MPELVAGTHVDLGCQRCTLQVLQIYIIRQFQRVRRSSQLLVLLDDLTCAGHAVAVARTAMCVNFLPNGLAILTKLPF